MLYASAVADQFPVLADDSMTWDNNGDWILTVRQADSSRYKNVAPQSAHSGIHRHSK